VRVDDVAIAGAGPAGSLAAIILARAGVRVRLFDRATFPRPKLCGDTLNPGALGVLQRHLDVSQLIAQSDSIEGMVLTGPRGVKVRATYGRGLSGRAITRDVLDQWLVSRAIEAGASFEEHVTVKDAVITGNRVSGLAVSNGAAVTHPARIVIAADGRRSNIAIGRGLAQHPRRPRRWAIGGYFTGVSGTTRLGEMHVRRGHYIGVAPVPGGLTNACLVIPHVYGDAPFASPALMLKTYLDADPELRARFADARPVAAPVTLGPMAIETRAAGQPGLLLAGDAAGFIDPMTGDGMHFALKGAELAAAAAMAVLDGITSIDRVHEDLARTRAASFSAKWRFNRALRSLVASPHGVSGAAAAATIAPSLFKRIIRFAGDCQHA
jgi:flavin-dependent dehydrogenase